LALLFCSHVCVLVSLYCCGPHRDLHSFPTRRSSDLLPEVAVGALADVDLGGMRQQRRAPGDVLAGFVHHLALDRDRHRADSWRRSEEHTSELQSRENLVCRLLLEKKKKAEDVSS